MIHYRQPDQILRKLVFVFLALVALAQVASCRGLYADGANMLVGILNTGDYLLFEKHRITHAILTQFPVVVAIQKGASLPFLRYLYSGMLVVLPLLFWGLALYLVRKDFEFWPFVMLFSFVYFNVGFIAISEFNLCFALAACCLAGILHRGSYTLVERALLMLAALLLPLEYAATLFIGPVLIVAALLRMKKDPDRNWILYWIVLVLVFLLSMASGLWEVITPRDPNNFAAARDPHILFTDARFWILLLYSFIVGLGLFTRKTGHIVTVLLLCLALLLMLLSGLSPWDPFYSYGIRAYMTFAFLGCCAALIWFSFHGRNLVISMPKSETTSLTLRYATPVFTLFVLMSLFDMELSLKHAEYIDHFVSELNENTGLLPYEQTLLQYDNGEKLFFRPWTHPVMSLVLRDGSDKAIILNPSWYQGYQEFDPQDHVPDLDRYYR